MTLTLKPLPPVPPLPLFSSNDAVKMMQALMASFSVALRTKGTSYKIPAFLDDLHRRGFTVVPLAPDEVVAERVDPSGLFPEGEE